MAIDRGPVALRRAALPLGALWLAIDRRGLGTEPLPGPQSKDRASRRKSERWVPIFPELRPYLEDAFKKAAEGAVHVITRYCETNTNLRTQLRRIIRRACLSPWPKLFQNMRASRETELATDHPLHVACAWIGNSALIANKHYLQVTEADFERGAKSDAGAAQKATQHPATQSHTESHRSPEEEAACEFASSDVAPRESTSDEKYAWRDSNPQPTAP